jgi:hypothetical protein
MSAIKAFPVLLAVVTAVSVGAPMAASAAGKDSPPPVSSILQGSGVLGPDGPLGKNGPLKGGGCVGANVNPGSLGPDGPLGPNGPLGPGGAAANKACAAPAAPQTNSGAANGAAPKAGNTAKKPAKAAKKKAHKARKHAVKAKHKRGGHTKATHTSPRKTGTR